jgi:hypothetical protein
VECLATAIDSGIFSYTCCVGRERRYAAVNQHVRPMTAMITGGSVTKKVISTRDKCVWVSLEVTLKLLPTCTVSSVVLCTDISLWGDWTGGAMPGILWLLCIGRGGVVPFEGGTLEWEVLTDGSDAGALVP